MCGVAGLVASEGNAFSRSDLLAMQAALRHRGPDGDGVHIVPSSPGGDGVQVGLAHTRLAVLDLTAAAGQPMSDETALVTISYNGEIYNYVELRRELIAAGHHFRSTGDTEVLLRGYLEWGLDVFRRAVGMFAVLVLDERSSELFGVRDRYGIKPLYYSRGRRGWSLASEIKAILTVNDLGPIRADPATMLRFLRYGSTDVGSATSYVGIEQVMPGHYFRIDLRSGASEHVRYDDAGGGPQLTVADLSFDEAAHTLRGLLLDSLRIHMRSDVPVGAALSGGLDSSSIVCGVGLHATDSPLTCFTYAARGSAISEERWAACAATAAGADLVVVAPTASDFVDEIQMLAASLDEPVAGPSLYAQFCVFRAARSAGVKVMLDGQGADELLGGYEVYVAARIAALVARGEVGRATKLLWNARRTGMKRHQVAARSLDHLLPLGLASPMRRLSGRPTVPAWVSSKWFAERGALIEPSPLRRPKSLREVLIEDVRAASLPSLLRYEDRSSMLHSVESRVPFLVPAIVDFCQSLPDEYLVSDDCTTKSVLRTAMRGTVPDQILDRSDKVGYAPPGGEWLDQTRSFVSGVLDRAATEHLPFLTIGAARDLVDRANPQSSLSAEVWRLVLLATWAETHDIAFD